MPCFAKFYDQVCIWFTDGKDGNLIKHFTDTVDTRGLLEITFTPKLNVCESDNLENSLTAERLAVTFSDS